jgi:polyhydroxybutyrate depolymerase
MSHGDRLPNDPETRIREATEAVAPRLIEIRRDIHAHPELAFQETRTAGNVLAALSRLGLRPRTGAGRNTSRRTAAISFLIGFVGLSISCSAAAVGATEALLERSLIVDGRTRSYVVYMPPQGPHERLPIVMVLHGQGGSGAQVLAQGHWQRAAARNHFALVAPDGVLEYPDRAPSFAGNRRSWNAGPASGAPAERQGINDVGFLRDTLDQVEQAFSIDRTRIYVTGFSNGAAMAFRVAAELPGRFAAVAPVANALLVPVSPMGVRTSLLLIWGTADPLNPIAGGEVRRTDTSYFRPSAERSLLAWGQALGCTGKVSSEALSPQVMRQRLDNCPARSEAQLVTIVGLGHQWPGGETHLSFIAGRGTDALNATEFILAFFSRHRLTDSR